MDVPLLELLSHQLRGELQFARHRKSLRKLAFVDDMIEGEDLQTLHVLHRLAMTALSNASVASKDIIFFSGTRASHAYLKLSGDLIYFTENAEEESVDSSAWIAEICLWTPWVYLGDLMAEDVTRLAILDADQFCEIMAQSWLTQRAAAKHARQYLETLKLKQDQTEWTDLFPRDDPQRSVSAGPFAADLPKQCCSLAWSCFCCLRAWALGPGRGHRAAAKAHASSRKRHRDPRRCVGKSHLLRRWSSTM